MSEKRHHIIHQKSPFVNVLGSRVAKNQPSLFSLKCDTFVSDMMRILLLNYEFPPLGGGAANATQQMLKEFVRLNVPVCVDVVTSSVGRAKVEQLSPGITVYYVDIHKRGSLHHQTNKDLLMYSVQAYRQARKLMAQHAYDGVHAYFGIPCGYIASKLGLPYIIALRGSDVPFYNKKYYWLDKLFFARTSRRLWKQAKAVTATSEGLKELALETAPNQKIQVIRNGVHIQDFHPTNTPHDVFTVISTSRLVERKGINYLIDAFVQFHAQYPKSRLCIAGEGEMMSQLKAQSQVGGAANTISFLGVVPHEKMAELYNESDVFALPSMNEGMSNSLLEAMSAGLAIVATDTGDSKYLVVGGGKIVPKRDAKSIAEFLEYAYTHPAELADMKKKNSEQTGLMSWSEVAKQTQELYNTAFAR